MTLNHQTIIRLRVKQKEKLTLLNLIRRRRVNIKYKFFFKSTVSVICQLHVPFALSPWNYSTVHTGLGCGWGSELERIFWRREKFWTLHIHITHIAFSNVKGSSQTQFGLQHLELLI